jgi:hypothetical protein
MADSAKQYKVTRTGTVIDAKTGKVATFDNADEARRAQAAATPDFVNQSGKVAAQGSAPGQRSAQVQIFYDEATKAGIPAEEAVRSVRTGTTVNPAKDPRVRSFVKNASSSGYSGTEIVNAAAYGVPLAAREQRINRISSEESLNTSKDTFTDNGSGENYSRNPDSPISLLSFRRKEVPSQPDGYSKALSDFEQRRAKSDERLGRIQLLANVLTLGKGTPYSQRSTVGKVAENVVTGLAGAPLFIGEKVLGQGGESIYLAKRAVFIDPKSTAKEVFLRAPQEVSKIYDPRTAEGITTYITAAAGAFAIAAGVRNAPNTNANFQGSIKSIKVQNVIETTGDPSLTPSIRGPSGVSFTGSLPGIKGGSYRVQGTFTNDGQLVYTAYKGSQKFVVLGEKSGKGTKYTVTEYLGNSVVSRSTSKGKSLPFADVDAGIAKVNTENYASTSGAKVIQATSQVADVYAVRGKQTISGKIVRDIVTEQKPTSAIAKSSEVLGFYKNDPVFTESGQFARPGFKALIGETRPEIQTRNVGIAYDETAASFPRQSILSVNKNKIYGTRQSGQAESIFGYQKGLLVKPGVRSVTTERVGYEISIRDPQKPKLLQPLSLRGRKAQSSSVFEQEVVTVGKVTVRNADIFGVKVPNPGGFGKGLGGPSIDGFTAIYPKPIVRQAQRSYSQAQTVGPSQSRKTSADVITGESIIQSPAVKQMQAPSVSLANPLRLDLTPKNTFKSPPRPSGNPFNETNLPPFRFPSSNNISIPGGRSGNSGSYYYKPPSGVKTKYKQSLFSNVFGFKGKESKQKTSTGLSLRPIK